MTNCRSGRRAASARYAVLRTAQPVDAVRRPERQFVIQKARHDQKVYTLPFSCQLVRSGRRSLSVLCLRRFPLLVQGRFACSGGLSLAYAQPAAFSLLVLSALFPVPNEPPRVSGGCGGRVWLVPVDGLGIGEGLLRYNRLGH